MDEKYWGEKWLGIQESAARTYGRGDGEWDSGQQITRARQGRAKRRLDRERVAQLRLRDSARPDPEWLAWTDGNAIVGASMSERRGEDTLGRSMRARRSRIELGRGVGDQGERRVYGREGSTRA